MVAEASFGVDFDNLDRVDVSDVPLFGSLFDRPLQAGDLTDANRVGAVYDAGDGTLAAVMDDDIDISDITISVVNGKGRFNFVMRPRVVETVPSALGAFGTLRSVQTTMAGAASHDTTLLLGGLTDRKVPAGEHKMPLLGDIPMLQSLFRGTVHQRDERELLILVKPSIIVREEEE